MQTTTVLVALLVAAVSAVPSTRFHHNRIVGGSLTTINNYPEITPTLYAPTGNTFFQFCAASILNQRSILTAAHCFDRGMNVVSRWRFRVGSSFASSGGVVHGITQIIVHPNYHRPALESDVAIMRSATTITYVNNAVQPASIAGANYNLADNQVVWAAGWGATESESQSEQLRHVQVWSINQDICNQRYGGLISPNMLCSGWLDVGVRDQCFGDSGGPLYHNRVVVGICSWGFECASPIHPGVNARVSRFTAWIQANA